MTKYLKTTRAKAQKHRHNRTIAELIILALNSFTKPVTFTMVKKLIKAAEIQISEYVLKMVVKKLLSKGHLKYANESRTRLTPNAENPLPKKGNSTLAKKRKGQTEKAKNADKKFRQHFKKLARKMQRKGKTVEALIYEHMSVKDGHWRKKYSFNQIQAYLRRSEVEISNFILKKVLERLRAKKVMVLRKGKNVVTGKKLKSRKKL